MRYFISLLLPYFLAMTPLCHIFSRDAPASNGSGNEIPDLITDRPDQTESAEVVPLFTLQVETGIFHEWVEKGMDTYIINTDFGGTLLRFGFHRILEARLGTGVKQTRAKVPGAEQDELHGMAPLSLGLKAKLLRERGFIPDLAFIAGYRIPDTGHPKYASGHLGQTYVLAFAHTLPGDAGLGYNLGFEQEGPELKIFTYSLVLGFAATEKTGLFLETYGNSTWLRDNDVWYRRPWDARVDAGLTFLVRSNFQLDISGGLGISDIAPRGFISGGFSWRIPH